jgi:SAM-dependent methyltransferase/ABC-type transporter Mla subunit MlaD
MIWGRSIIAAILARLERRFGLPELQARQAALVGLSEQILAQTNRLNAEVAAGLAAADERVSQLSASVQKLNGEAADGFTAMGARFDADIANLAGVSRQLDERVSRLFESVQKLGSDFTTAGERRDAHQANTADQNRQLDERLSQIFELMQGLGSDFVATGERRDADHANTTDHSRQLDERVQQLSDFVQTLDSHARSALTGINNRLEQDLVILANQIQQLGANVTQLADFMQNLDKNVAQNFAGVGQRLDADLVTLARTVQDLIESSRHAAGTLAKLAADQIQFGDAARRSGGDAPFSHVLEGAVAGPAPLLRPDEAALPASVRTAIAARGFASGASMWRLNPDLLPQTQEALPRWLEIMAACRAGLKAGERLVWAQPVEAAPLLAESEIEQVLGLIGAVDIFQVEDKPTPWRVAIATRRVEGAGVTLRWSLPALEALHIHLRPLVGEMLRRLNLGDVAHAVDLPEPGADIKNWARLLPSFLAAIAGQDDVRIGVTLPIRFDEAPEAMDEALAHLGQALREGGMKEEIAFQWVRGAAPVAKSPAVLAFARRHRIGFDLTPVSRRTPESRLAAYDDRVPYRALDFDLRLPSFDIGQSAVIEVPRWSGRASETALAAGGRHRRLVDLFEDDFTRDADRLARILDRRGQKQFELQVNLDATLIDYWPRYFVYNWAPPAPAWLRMFEFDAAELFAAGSPLIRLCGDDRIGAADSRFLSGAQFFAAAAEGMMRVPADQDSKQLQIDAHAYLRERREMTADAERLIGWMPEQLGATLELGSGLGLMARRLRRRASLYVGIDLTTGQAEAVRAAGADALVADIHRLPFADSSFDTIIADNVVEHAVDPLQVLCECRRVLKPGGRSFLIIPPDYIASEFSNRAHLWKADAESAREALRSAGFRILREETVRLAELGVSGAYPSSNGETGLWQVEKPANSPVEAELAERERRG